MEFSVTRIEALVRRSWRSFVLAFTMVVVVQILQLLNFRPFTQFISPLSTQVTEIHGSMMDVLRPRLHEKPNSYFLNTNESPFVSQASANMGPSEAAAYALVDFESGDVLADKKLSTPLPIASLTKIMTAVVTLDLAHADEQFRITENAAEQVPSKIGVVPGEQMRVDELLHALLLTSANDAAEALKDGVDAKYGAEVFINAMNEKARFIGLKNTSFQNPQGFDSKTNYSTVEDLAILSHYALTHYPEISEIVAKDYTFLPEDEHHKQFDLNNWNGLIGVYPETTGIKIGNTGRAKKTTVVVSERGGKKLLAVVLGAPGLYERDQWAADLLDYGYEVTLGLPPVDVTKEDLQRKYNSWYAAR